jgi:hypothetical protein
MPERDHLFISYAWEDGALAEWLTLKLTAAGYRVWCDRFKMLGGECWPEDIDVAIKTQTFRMLHLLSKHSLHKDMPSKERQLGFTLSKERKEDFLIPLNVDGIRPSELPWQMSDINFIGFQNWGDGLRQLLKKLASIDAPKPLAEEGGRVAAETFLPVGAVVQRTDVLQSNCLPFTRVPVAVKRFRLNRALTRTEEEELARAWAFYKADDQSFLAFTHPSSKLIPDDLNIWQNGGYSWQDVREMEGINSVHVVTSLLRKSLTVKCIEKGLKPRDDGRFLYFPSGLLEKDRIKYKGYKGRLTRVNVIGERKARGGRIKYHVGVSLNVRRDVVEGFVAVTKIHLHLVGKTGQTLETPAAIEKRKKIARSWWNHEWLSRQMAIRSFLADGGEEIVIGGGEPKEQIVIAAIPIEAYVPVAINEEFLRPLGVTLRAMHPEEVDTGEEDESAREAA